MGEYSYKYGISNWLVLGVPYYVAALLFALFLARKARETELLTIPDRLNQVYGRPAALAGASIVFLMAIPGAYIVMLGVLFQMLFGWPFWVGVLFGTGFSTIYVFLGGFKALVRNDLFQFALMFLGFAVLLIFLFVTYGGPGYIAANVPSSHLTWHGGRTTWAVAVWYFIALTTLTEPAFFQRCYAAKTPQVARARDHSLHLLLGAFRLYDHILRLVRPRAPARTSPTQWRPIRLWPARYFRSASRGCSRSRCW